MVKAVQLNNDLVTPVDFYFVLDPSVNRLLNKYQRSAREEDIRFFADVCGIMQNMFREEFCQVLELALDEAITDCVETTKPTRRFIKFSTMNRNKKVFVKISYSFETSEQKEKSIRICQIREIMKRINGYFDIKQDDDTLELHFVSHF